MGRNDLWLRLYFQSSVFSPYDSITNNKCLFHITACTPSTTPMYYLTVLWVRSPSRSISFCAYSLTRTKSSAYIWWLRSRHFQPIGTDGQIGALKFLFSYWLWARDCSQLLGGSFGSGPCPTSTSKPVTGVLSQNSLMSLSVTSQKKLVFWKTSGRG